MKRLFFLAAGMFALGCEDYLFAGLLPGIAASLHTSVVAVAQGCVVFGLAYILSVPLCAFLLSRQPVRRVLITALVLFIAGNVMTLLSPDLMFYIGSRFVSGLGAGLFLPVAVAAGTQLVEPGFEGRALSVIWGANCAGAVAGVPLGLWLAARMGWQATVVLIMILAAFALAGIVIRKQPLRVEAPPPSLGEQFRLLLDRRVLAVIGVTLLTATGCLGLYSYITQVLAGTGNPTAVAFSLWSVGGLIGTAASGYVVDRVGKPRVVMAAILGVLFLTITALPVLRWVPIAGLLPFLVWGAMGWASVTAQQCSLIKIKADHEAILVALNSSAVSLGAVVGTALGGAALAGGLSAGKLPYVTSIFLFCALVCQMLLIRANSRNSADSKTNSGEPRPMKNHVIAALVLTAVLAPAAVRAEAVCYTQVDMTAAAGEKIPMSYWGVNEGTSHYNGKNGAYGVDVYIKYRREGESLTGHASVMIQYRPAPDTVTGVADTTDFTTGFVELYKDPSQLITVSLGRSDKPVETLKSLSVYCGDASLTRENAWDSGRSLALAAQSPDFR